MPDIISMPDPSAGGGTYTAPDDIYETLDDERVIQIARKGQTIPMVEAVRLGLVKAPPAPPIQETKTRDLAAAGEAPKPKVSVGAPPVSKAAPGHSAPYGAERAPAAAPADGEPAAAGAPDAEGKKSR